jgi:hypothetical protein
MKRQDDFGKIKTINQVILDFTNYLLDSGRAENTAMNYRSYVRKVYREMFPEDDFILGRDFFVPNKEEYIHYLATLNIQTSKINIHTGFKAYIVYLKSQKLCGSDYTLDDVKVKVEAYQTIQEYFTRDEVLKIAKYAESAKDRVAPMLCFEGLLTRDSLAAIREIDFDKEKSILTCYKDTTRKEIKSVLSIKREIRKRLIDAFEEMNDYVDDINRNAQELNRPLRNCDYLYQSKTSIKPTKTAIQQVFWRISDAYCKKNNLNEDETEAFKSRFNPGMVKDSGKVYILAQTKNKKDLSILSMQYGEVDKKKWKMAAKVVDIMYPNGV